MSICLPFISSAARACTLRRALLALGLSLGLSLGMSAAQAAKLDFLQADRSPDRVQTEHVQAQLLAHAPDGVKPGGKLWVGLSLDHAPQWHTYWKNAGDSGLPTTLSWQLPAGVTAGDIVWPLPHKIAVGDLANYGYEGQVLLPVPLSVGRNFTDKELNVVLKANWLVCRRECVPEQAELSLRIPAAPATTPSPEQSAPNQAQTLARFQASWDAVPQTARAGRLQVRLMPDDGRQLELSATGLPPSWQGQPLQLFSEAPEIIETAAKENQKWQGAQWVAQVPLSAYHGPIPASMAWVLAPPQRKQPLRFVATVQGQPVQASASSSGTVTPTVTTAASPASSAPAPMQPVAPVAETGESMGLAWALFGAMLGGMILNLMPCVFPVLAIKVLHLTEHASDPRTRVQTGLAYSVGVVVSFLLLGALLLVLRAAGESLGWGFQLQNPWVVGGLALLFTLIGLNLLGLFEVGQVLPSSILNWEARHPMVDAFGGGVLAVAVASPCTAPFMGASLGLTLSLPTAQALLIFAAIGIGMALPYLLLVSVPHLVERLPRPGAWMLWFKKLMALPMFLTVFWLGWVLYQQIGPQPDPANTQPTARDSARDNGWQPWSPERVEQALAAGQPVLVDFTAAWCVTCQVNKKTVLNDADLLADMQARGVLKLEADWTRQDARITAALKQLGRSGVPVYLLLAPGRPPVVMSEILSVAEVRGHLAALPRVASAPDTGSR